MKMRFTKMHGLGNDYIYFDLISQPMPETMDWAQVAVSLSNRHTGIGGDGVVLILPDEVCDCRMRIFNADGSEAEMCGNASRCIGKYVYEHGLVKKTDITLATKAGMKRLMLQVGEKGVEEVCVDMGKGEVVSNGLRLAAIGIEEEEVLTLVNMGNPHAVLFTEEEPTDTMVRELGARIEKAPYFAEGTNVEFVRIVNRSEICMRVWERGSGETMACGTGACASVVAARYRGLVDEEVTMHLLGGDLRIAIREDGHVMMTGPAAEVFSGEVDLRM